ncbi:MAG TPA: hypothetical protein VJZ04_06285 [Lachnospiraceae bacterium]|nr:hypothetical protein [Lachnospiraceae bacterium]
MKAKIRLIPGMPDDENRDYLPEKLQQNEWVVNENGNNSHVFPKRLKKYKECLVGEIEDTWYEYIPESYDSEKKTPLVLSMHGGLMTGWGQAIYTSWTLVADREGFIVVFPNAGKDRIWMMECDWEKVKETSDNMPSDVPLLHKPEEHVKDYHDVKMTVALIERMKEKYNIDYGRIYMQGMSMGNAMTCQFARYMGHILAGAAGSGCPTNTKLLFDENETIINLGGPLDIWQSRLELDQVPPHYKEKDRITILKNCKYWNQINNSTALPKIRIRGDYNFAFFDGDKGNTVLMDVKNRDHGQTIDDAEYVWDYLFSGCYKDEKGLLRHTTPDRERKGDDFNIAIMEGCKKVWVNNLVIEMEAPAFQWKKLKYHGLHGEAIVRGEYLYVPVSFLAKVFLIDIQNTENGFISDFILADGTEIQFAKGNISCVVNNRIESMSCEAVERDHVLYVPLEWFVKRFYQMQTSSCEGVLYVTDHDASISKYMAYLLMDILQERF